MSLEKKYAVVTGCTRGIGRQISSLLIQNEYVLIGVYKQSEAEAESLRIEIAQQGGTCFLFSADVSQMSALSSLTEQISSITPKLDLLVHNAGIYRRNEFAETTEEVWEATFNTNLRSVYFLTQKLLSLLQNSEQAQIINIGSVSGRVIVKDSLDYALAKQGVLYLTQCWAKMFAPQIRVNAIAPGPTVTDMTGYATNAEKKYLAQKNTPLGRVNEVEDVAAIVDFLLSKGAKNMTGQIIGIDGGRSL